MDTTREYNMKVLMQPWLAYGHISPYLELAKKLSERNFYIYFCSTPINLTTIRKKLNPNHLLSIQLVELHLPSSPDLPPSHHTTNGLPPHLMTTLKTAFDASNFSEILTTLTPDLVIYDQNQPWAPAIASSHNIPAIQFLTFGAAVISSGLHAFKNAGEAFPYQEIQWRNFKRAMVHSAEEQTSPSKDELMKEANRFIEALNRSCDIVLVKSFREIEGKYIDYLSTLAGKKVVPVGPLVEDPIVSEDEKSKNIIQWLDKKNKSSTVFVSFGSECFLTKEEVEELAHGLELSEVNFIWVIRFPAGEKVNVDLVLPEGFLNRVKERGIIVEGWAPQVEILRHPSIGGFVSHCGWNSFIESMKFGVPIVAVPMQLDQPLNARLIEEVGVGVEVRRDEGGGLRREEIAKVIRSVVVEKDGEVVRTNARKFSGSMALKKEEEMDEVVDELSRLILISRRKNGK